MRLSTSRCERMRIIGIVLLSIISSYGNVGARSLGYETNINATTKITEYPQGKDPAEVKPSTYLAMDASPYNKLMGYPSENAISPNAASNLIYYAAYASKDGRYHGVKASLDVYQVSNLDPSQVSGASLWVSDGTTDEDRDVIGVGWAVYPNLYKDNNAHLTVYFNARGKGRCYNLLCHGFTQTHGTIKPGTVLVGGTPSGERKPITVMLSQDPQTEDWVLSFGNGEGPVERIGFWEKGFFASMPGYAVTVTLGGFAGSYVSLPSPAMGSGHQPDDDAAARIYNIMFINPNQKMYVPLGYLDHSFTVPPIYMVSNLHVRNEGCFFFYGGQGGLTS